MKKWLLLVWHAARLPIIAAVLSFTAMVVFKNNAHYLHDGFSPFLVNVIDNYIFPIFFILVLLWFSYRLIDATLQYLNNSADGGARIVAHILQVTKTAFKIAVFIFLTNVWLPAFNLPDNYYYAISKGLDITLIGLIAWIFLNIPTIIEEAFTQKYKTLNANQIVPRAIFTKLQLFKRITVSIIIIVAVAAELMTFEQVRQLGVSLLASAGVVTLIAGFAAQKTLGTFFSGLQIAFTQPLRIGDTVVVEGELGTVEDINLSQVIIRVWDKRCMVLPINYFLEKPFQNWTLNSTDLIGDVFWELDYIAPVEQLRTEFMRLIKQSPLWDGKTATFQVTDCKERTMRIRALVSAADSNSVWNLRCEMREKLIAFIGQHYPDALPKVRMVSDGPDKP